MRRTSRGIVSWTMSGLLTLGLSTGVVLFTAKDAVLGSSLTAATSVATTTTRIPTKAPATTPATTPSTQATLPAALPPRPTVVRTVTYYGDDNFSGISANTTARAPAEG